MTGDNETKRKPSDSLSLYLLFLYLVISCEDYSL